LAHEINQPLASVSLLCEAARRMVLTHELSMNGASKMSKQLPETLVRIASEIQRAGTVLRSLLTSVNKPDITRAPAILNELIADSITTALEEGVFGYTLIADCAADLPRIKVNPLQIKKVLLNLIHNGAQAMQGAQTASGKIVVSAALAADAQEICITVQDEGPGISALMQQEIFQPYISTKTHGMGLGLTISRALIEAHGGKLWGTQVPGQGAAFHFTLPTEG
jgi:signal transduction histidine kinase